MIDITVLNEKFKVEKLGDTVAMIKGEHSKFFIDHDTALELLDSLLECYYGISDIESLQFQLKDLQAEVDELKDAEYNEPDSLRSLGLKESDFL